jgi:hypothetical protein
MKALLQGASVRLLRSLDVNPILGLPTLSTLDTLPPSVSIRERISFLDLCAVRFTTVWDNTTLRVPYAFSFPRELSNTVPCTLFEVGNGADTLLQSNLPTSHSELRTARFTHNSVLDESTGTCLCGCQALASEGQESDTSLLAILLPLLIGVALLVGLISLVLRRRRTLRQVHDLKFPSSNIVPQTYVRPPRKLPAYLNPPVYPEEGDGASDDTALRSRGKGRAPPYVPPPAYIIPTRFLPAVQTPNRDLSDPYFASEPSDAAEDVDLVSLELSEEEEQGGEREQQQQRQVGFDYNLPSSSVFFKARPPKTLPAYEAPPPFSEETFDEASGLNLELANSPSFFTITPLSPPKRASRKTSESPPTLSRTLSPYELAPHNASSAHKSVTEKSSAGSRPPSYEAPPDFPWD